MAGSFRSTGAGGWHAAKGKPAKRTGNPAGCRRTLAPEAVAILDRQTQGGQVGRLRDGRGSA